MEYEEFESLDNNLMNYNLKDEKKINIFETVNVEDYLNKMNLDESNGAVIYYEKIQLLLNNEWYKDTYIKSNNDITKGMVKNYIKKLEPDYKIKEIKYEFHGGPPMGTIMFDYREIEGDNVWVVNLEPKIEVYLRKKGKIGDLENIYDQFGGNLNDEIIKTINNFFLIEQDDILDEGERIKKELDKFYYKDISQTNTFYDGYSYYTFINIFKDGKYLDKVKVISNNNPIKWNTIFDNVINLNKYSDYYGNIYNMSHSINKGIILETTSDKRYFVNYNCNLSENFNDV